MPLLLAQKATAWWQLRGGANTLGSTPELGQRLRRNNLL